MSGSGLLPRQPERFAQAEESPAALDGEPAVLTFAEAESVGCALFDRWGSIAGAVSPPLARDALAWGDLVQFVLRRAGEVVRDRPEPGGAA